MMFRLPIPLYRFVDRAIYKPIEAFAALGGVGLQFILAAFFHGYPKLVFRFFVLGYCFSRGFTCFGQRNTS